MFTSEKMAGYMLALVGVTSIIVGMLGLWFNSGALSAHFSSVIEDLGKEYDLKNFYPIFYMMLAICMVFYLTLVVSGIQLIRKKVGWVFVLLAVVVLEVFYFVTVGWLWAHSPYNYSIGAATGISSGGLMYQAKVLFPVWAPLIALWARRRIINQATTSALADRLPS